MKKIILFLLIFAIAVGTVSAQKPKVKITLKCYYIGNDQYRWYVHSRYSLPYLKDGKNVACSKKDIK
jgi:hypothetical protein